jgi:hypothetical protein
VAGIAHEAVALDLVFGRRQHAQVGEGGGDAAEGDRAVGAMAIDMQPGAHRDAVVEVDLAPLVAIAAVAAVGVHAEVARRPLPVDPAGVSLHRLAHVAPLEGAAEAHVALKVRVGAVLSHARLHAGVCVAADRHRGLARIELERQRHAASVGVASDQVDRIGEGQERSLGVAPRRPPAGAERGGKRDVEAAARDGQLVAPADAQRAWQIVLRIGAVVAAGEIEERQGVEVGAQALAHVVEREDHEEGPLAPRHLSAQAAGDVVGVRLGALIAFGGGKGQLRVGRREDEGICAPRCLSIDAVHGRPPAV